MIDELIFFYFFLVRVLVYICSFEMFPVYIFWITSEVLTYHT